MPIAHNLWAKSTNLMLYWKKERKSTIVKIQVAHTGISKRRKEVMMTLINLKANQNQVTWVIDSLNVRTNSHSGTGATSLSLSCPIRPSLNFRIMMTTNMQKMMPIRRSLFPNKKSLWAGIIMLINNLIGLHLWTRVTSLSSKILEQSKNLDNKMRWSIP